MRGWLGLVVVCWSSLALADDAAFSSASLGGALAGAVAATAGDVPPAAGVMTVKNREVFDRVVSNDISAQLGTFGGDVVAGKRAPDAGPQPKVVLGTAEGDTGGLTADEIGRVLKSRAGILRACYQKELNRTPKLAGKIVVRIGIAEDGGVISATITSTTMRSSAVESCISAQLMRIKFPARGAKAFVTYPFIFTAG